MDLNIREVRENIKKQILDFSIQGVEKFLINNPDLVFYAFAFDCNAEYAEINLCFNTEIAFQKTLRHYQAGEYTSDYQSEEDIKYLRYNTGDWAYQCFDTLYVFSEDDLNDILNKLPDDDYKSWNIFTHDLLNIFTESLMEFTKTDVYTKIPKAEDFTVFSIDHDEDLKEAIERYNSILL